MADLVLKASFEASAGTAVPIQSEFIVEVTLSCELGDDFVGDYDDCALLTRITTDLADLSGRRLDDIIGRATLENLASYIHYSLRDICPQSVRVSARASSVVLYREDLPKSGVESQFAFKRGVSHALRGDAVKAVAAFRDSIQLAPNARAFNALGRCLRGQGKLSEAFDAFDSALRIDPDFGDAYRNRGNILLEIGRKSDMLADFDRAVELMPRSALAYNNRGYAYRVLGDHSKALADHNRAIDLDPKYEEAYRDRAFVLTALGQKKRAEADLEIAESLRGYADDLALERSKLNAGGSLAKGGPRS